MDILKNIKLIDNGGLSLMSSEMQLMKNLIDMGIVEYNSMGTLTCSFTTPDNNYIINLKRKPRLSFLAENSMSSYLCEIEFITALGTPILTIQSDEIEMSKMLDSFYNLVELNIGDEICYYFNPISSNCITRLLQLSVKEKEYVYNQFGLPYTQVCENLYTLSVFDKSNNNSTILRLSTEMSYGVIFEFLEKIYYTFLIDVDKHYLE